MRIALYHNLLSGGAKRTLLEATKRLTSRHQVDAYTLSCSEHDFADIRPWVARHRVFPFKPFPLLKSPFGRLNQVSRCADLRRLRAVASEIAQQIERIDYDVVLVHPCQFEQGPSVLKFLERTPSVYYCHEPLRLLYEAMPARPYGAGTVGARRILNRLDPLPALYRRMLRDVDQGNTRSAGTVLVNSRFTARSVLNIYGVEAQVSYHGVDIELFKPTRVAKGNFVLSVGSLTPLKGFDFLIHAMAQYPGAGRPALVIASNFQNPPERAYLENLAREMGVELRLSGAVADQDLVQLYNEARVVVYAPIREPFGLVPLEAMACATPVVAVAEGGVSETVVDGQTGLLVEREPARFAAAIRRLVDDQPMARRLGDQGLSHVRQHWTWDRAVASLEGHLKSSAEAHSSVTPPVPVLAQ